MLDSHRARLTTFKNNIRKYIPNVPVSNVHSGYRYFIRDAEVEFLFTYEDLFPLTVRDMSLNASSSVFTVTIKTKKPCSWEIPPRNPPIICRPSMAAS